ncbi:DedA family protein [Brevibacterium spongiae]|uniref:DedA family protein n=1 Tax=Brevibacterium spongiae TaxID=2909672 RepID=A0ABY5SWQ1_9MICO|nr:DedA family protein [Brevibacterium spongiae]UVI37516.1 DedA family protein [Brevibacterium spongiae]
MDLALELLTAVLTSPWVYLLIAVAASLDSLVPVVPSETLLISAAAFSASGIPHPAGLVLAAVLGALAGDLAAHGVGRFARSRLARSRTRRSRTRPSRQRASRLGRSQTSPSRLRTSWLRQVACRLRQRTSGVVDSACSAFARRGASALVAGRFIPGGRTLTTIGSGMLRFPVRRFLLWDAIGSLAWALYSTGIGLIGGAVFDDRPLLGVAVGIGIALFITGAAEFVRRLRRTAWVSGARIGKAPTGKFPTDKFRDAGPRVDTSRGRSGIMETMSNTHVWYVSYGSNMARDRLACYLQGGRPPGAHVTYPGARDGTPPRAEAGIELPGAIYFAGASKVWGGGMAFYDHHIPGPTPAKAYLITAAQFADVAAQEMHRRPAADSPLERLVFDLPAGSSHSVGPGGYETLLVLDVADGVPVVTFTAPHGSADIEHTQPSAPYLAMLRTGAAEVSAASGQLLHAAARV